MKNSGLYAVSQEQMKVWNIALEARSILREAMPNERLEPYTYQLKNSENLASQETQMLPTQNRISLLVCSLVFTGCSTVTYWAQENKNLRETAGDLHECRVQSQPGGQKI